MKKFGLLGRSLSHSRSPELHRLLGSVPYGLYEVEPEMLEGFLQTTDLSGINVTIPYKKAVLPYCTALSETAKRVGCVNTLLRCKDGWFGDNTDYFGFSYMVKDLIFTGKKALILGSGGAAAVVRAVLEKKRIGECIMISRTGADNYCNLDRHQDARILINATPVGMYPENGKAPVSLDDFPHCEAVLDLIYNPLRSALLSDAKAHGIPGINGLTMLAAQAYQSAELFLGRPLDESLIGSITDSLHRQMENIVLIGMPGCGKSTVGQCLAKLLDREFADSDALLAAKVGMSAAAFLIKYGENAFREQETAVLRELGSRTGLVIATGGGCVTVPENLPLLRQNGRLIWLKRDTAVLPTEGRPLSQTVTTAELLRRRESLYSNAADAWIENNGSPTEAAVKIKEML